ncbi:Acetyl esterase/lipase [Poseidonocella pacifica]|uniref:Acetyl esterase/lipase n=1 Tax=Poseidonocella pacifica TaxID=871651 RepID=A0A1I0YZQ3_9RHOB|nr:alpha/beta hydrolase [Poseidonocella pacifica]SFB18326.1 Acetyl esterase/lipase [Poseidonocella pacifica]
MISRRLRLANLLLRAIGKPSLQRIETPEEAARGMARSSRFFLAPPGLVAYRDRAGFARVQVGRIAPRRALLYFHGGGYVAGGLHSYRAMLGRLSLLTGLHVVMPEYRLAQEAPFPAAYGDAFSAWVYLRHMGYRAEDIVIGGDSAGGGLALSLLAGLCVREEPPRAVFVIGPWTDLAGTGESLQSNAERDPFLPADRVGELVDFYLGGASAEDPRASPLYAEFPKPPPVLLQVGEDEILRDDAVRMAARLGPAATLRLWDGVHHVWHMGDGWFPEARAGLVEIADFVQAAFTEESSASR